VKHTFLTHCCKHLPGVCETYFCYTFPKLRQHEHLMLYLQKK